VSKVENEPEELGDPDWFRAPTARERWIGGALFIGFGVFFVALFIVLSGWWFRWVILVLGGYSMVIGLKHLRGMKAV
jgi:fatty acid desaturase